MLSLASRRNVALPLLRSAVRAEQQVLAQRAAPAQSAARHMSTQQSEDKKANKSAYQVQAEKKYGTSLSQVADRTADLFFLTEIMGAIWLCFKVAMQPKVSTLHESSTGTRSKALAAAQTCFPRLLYFPNSKRIRALLTLITAS
jgi:hypothetical protein